MSLSERDLSKRRLNLYSDVFWSPDQVEKRQFEFSSHWEKITDKIQGFRVANILEIGPGGGGETKALKAFYSESYITVVDFDPRAEEAAERNGVDVVSLDLAVPRSPKWINQLVNVKDINTVIALRTSRMVAANLINWWDGQMDTNRRLLAFSLMRETEGQDAMTQIRRQSRARGGRQVPLVEGRVFNEIATVLVR